MVRHRLIGARDLHAVLTGMFGPVHRKIGRMHQFAEIAGYHRWDEEGAHAAGQRILPLRKQARQPRVNAEREALSFGYGRHVQKETELIAAQPPHKILAAHDRGQAVGEGAQYGVAGAVSVCAVDRFEIVQVQNDEQEGGVAATCRLDPLAGAAIKS
nr:hypothetical protein [Sphingobium xenophagum]